MAELSLEKLKARSDKAQSEMDSNRGMFEDAYEFVMPFRNVYSRSGSHNKPTRQYDSTAMISANNFVNTMQKNFTPPFTRWADFKAGPGIDEDDKVLFNSELSKIAKLVFAYLDSSNFSTASSEMYFDLGIGTGVLLMLEGDEIKPLNFLALPLAEISLEEGRFGEICALYRKKTHKTKDLKATWPKGKFGVELEKIISGEKKDKDGKQITEVEIMEAIYLDYESQDWYYDVIHFTTETRIMSETYKEAPFVAPRWLKIPGFATGIGPFVMAMADIKTLNKMKEYMLQLAALNIFGIYTVTNNSSINLSGGNLSKPGTFITVESNGGSNGPSISELPRSGNFQVQEFIHEDLKNQIRQVMLDNRLPQEAGPVQTAFEISQRIKELSTDIGSAFGRIMFEYILPLFRRTISILIKKGKIQVPKEVEKFFNIDNFYIQVQVISPLAKQQSIEDLQSFAQAFQMISSVSPELAQIFFDTEKAAKFIVDKTGTDAELIRGEDNRAELMDKVAQTIAQLQMTQQGGQPQQQPQIAQ